MNNYYQKYKICVNMLLYNKQQIQYVYICVPKFWTVQSF